MNSTISSHLFSAEIGPGLWLISSDLSGPNENGHSMKPGRATSNSFLIEGDREALLIDLAVDEPGLVNYAQALTGKKVLLALTHGHVDHTFRLNDNAREVWMHPDDIFLLWEGFAGPPVESMPSVHPLQDGDVIELGQRAVRVIHLAGHTPGSLLFYDLTTSVLFSGDTVTRRLLYGLHGFVPLKDFCASLGKLLSLPIAGIYSAHDRFALKKEHIGAMISVLSHADLSLMEPVSLPVQGRFYMYRNGVETDPDYFNWAVKLPENGDAL